jgi:hypothetical protein
MLGAPAQSLSPCQVYPGTTRGAPEVHEVRPHAGRPPRTRHHADPVAIARHGRRGRAGSCVLSAWWFGTASSSCRGLSGPGLCGGRSMACAMPSSFTGSRAAIAEPSPVPRQPNGPESSLCRARSHVMALSWCFCSRQAVLRYSLIRPWTTCLRLIRAVTSTAWPGLCSGGRCSRDWCGRW